MLLRTARPKPTAQADVMVYAKQVQQIQQMQQLVIKTHKSVRQDDYLPLVILHCESLQITHGLLIMWDETMAMIEEDVTKERRKADQKRLEKEKAAEAFEAIRGQKRIERAQFENWGMERCAALYCDQQVLSCLMKMRIVVIKQRKTTVKSCPVN